MPTEDSLYLFEASSFYGNVYFFNKPMAKLFEI